MLVLRNAVAAPEIAAAPGGGTASFRDSQSASGNGSTTGNLSFPSAPQDGDLLVAVLAQSLNTTSNPTTPPPGWEKLPLIDISQAVGTGSHRVQAYYRKASGESNSYAWTWGATADWSILMLRYSVASELFNGPWWHWHPFFDDANSGRTRPATIRIPMKTTDGLALALFVAKDANGYYNNSTDPSPENGFGYRVGNVNTRYTIVCFDRTIGGPGMVGMAYQTSVPAATMGGYSSLLIGFAKPGAHEDTDGGAASGGASDAWAWKE
jgi:hypothetical protein